MPSIWLNVPHFQQELDYACVAACVRRVLAHYHDIRTEAELRFLLDTQPTGTAPATSCASQDRPTRFTCVHLIGSSCKRC